MRKAAGILMVILGMATIGFLGYYLRQGIEIYSLAFNLTVIISAVFVITGGVFCLKKKYWIVCLISSLLLPCFVIRLWFWFFPYGLGLFFIPGGIISLIFVCLRKSEWRQPSA